MAIDARELGRLAILQREPMRYVERRVEELDLKDDHHYGVTLTQQVEIPGHGDSGSPEERELLVPLGQFSKDRLPDLRVEGPHGERLPLLTRVDRGVVGATLLTNQWAHTFFADIPRGDRESAKRDWKAIFSIVARAVVGTKREAEVALEALERTLRSWTRPGRKPAAIQLSALALLCNKRFWIEAIALSETRPIVARMRGVPGGRYTLTVRYTERFAYRNYAQRSPLGVGRRILAELGLVGMPIARAVANVGGAASLWIVQSVPEGVEALRYYWRSARRSTGSPDPVSVEVSRAVASSHTGIGPKSQRDLLLLDIQIAPSGALIAAIGLAALLLLVSTYVYQAVPLVVEPGEAGAQAVLASTSHAPLVTGGPDESDRALLVGLGSVFAALPAAVAGALAYRGRSIARRISRGPRTLLAILSGIAAFFAIVVSLKNLGSLTEGTAYVVSIYSLWVLGMFGFVQVGPRFRKNEHTKLAWVTRNMAPKTCRSLQIWIAFGWLVGWTAGVVVFARCQAALQHEHFFSSDFPVNIWHAWWSWFF